MTLNEIRTTSETNEQRSTAIKSNDRKSLPKYRSFQHEYCEVDAIILFYEVTEYLSRNL